MEISALALGSKRSDGHGADRLMRFNLASFASVSWVCSVSISVKRIGILVDMVVPADVIVVLFVFEHNLKTHPRE